jgi:hypothetical protein
MYKNNFWWLIVAHNDGIEFLRADIKLFIIVSCFVRYIFFIHEKAIKDAISETKRKIVNFLEILIKVKNHNFRVNFIK